MYLNTGDKSTIRGN
ncbi:hypothetical protein RDI58_024402 [Solanum bulbocastanum]|uniref:Uncharacterized protein n=1 Tax=Solanum bulbocastanum TaxID=147425 RepID=A0AAN8Y3A7_SOLBU